MIQRLTQGPRALVDRINEIITEVNAMTSPSRSDGAILVSQTPGGRVPAISTRQLNPKIPNVSQLIQVRRAKTTQAAPAGTTITANLYDFNGVEQTIGDESGITVYCTVVDGSANLNAALPRLRDNEDLFVAYLPYSSTAYRWYCLQLFQPSEDC